MSRDSLITPKRYEIRCQLLLITNAKSHAYGLSIDTDLDDVERRNGFHFAFFTEFDCFAANYVTVVEGRPMSVKYCILVPVFNFWP